MKPKNGYSGTEYPRCSHRGARHTAFTLIEILVVISIVAILVVLVFAAIKPMIMGANAAKCSANLRQIGAGLSMYMSENQQKFPPTRDYSATTPNLYSVLKPYLPINNDQTRSDLGIWACPGDKRDARYLKYSYGFNWQLGGSKANPANIGYDSRYAALPAIQKPASKLLYAVDLVSTKNSSGEDSIGSSSTWPLPAGSMRDDKISKNRLDFDRHGNFVNGLFLDGSVRRLGYDDVAETTSQFTSPVAAQ